MTIVTITSDGSCPENPGAGGYAALLMFAKHDGDIISKCFQGNEDATTNNRMELMAVIIGLEALTRPCEVVLWVDSKYVLKGATQWTKRWQKNGWRTADKQAVKNHDLWKRLLEAMESHIITWNHTPGHRDDNTDVAYWNNFVDSVARTEAEKIRES